MYLVGSSAIYLVNNSNFLLVYSDQVPVGLYMFSSGFSVRRSKPKFKDNAMNYILVFVQNTHMVFIIFIWLCLVGRMENGEMHGF